MKWLIKLLIPSISLFLVSWMLPQYLHIDGFKTAVIAAIILGIANTFIRPILSFFTSLLTFMTLGLFTLVINAVMYAITDYFVSGFGLAGFMGYILVPVVASIVNTVLNAMVGK